MAESQNIEWKESWRDEYLKWIIARDLLKAGDAVFRKFVMPVKT